MMVACVCRGEYFPTSMPDATHDTNDLLTPFSQLLQTSFVIRCLMPSWMLASAVTPPLVLPARRAARLAW